jgi:hypothetical protein
MLALRRDYPRLVEIGLRLAALGNIRFHPLGDEQRIVYYPSGLLFALRLPVVSANRAAWEQARVELEHGEAPSYLQLLWPRGGILFHLSIAGELSAETISVVDLTTPLAPVIDAVRWCFDRQLPAPERAYRLAVLDPSVAAAGVLVIETGDRSRGDLATYVYPDDPPGSPPGRSHEEAAHLFVETVARHLRASSLRRQDQYVGRSNYRAKCCRSDRELRMVSGTRATARDHTAR